MIALEVDKLTARHGLLIAVRAISFQVKPGEALAIIGANGAGKSTLLRAIAGLHRDTTGAIRLNGRDITQLSAAGRAGAGLAMVPEGRRLFTDMTVRENLQVAWENGRKGEWTMRRVIDALPMLSTILPAVAGSLSGGQRQAVAIGRALMSNPSILLLDEVSLGLSPIAVGDVYESLRALRTSGAVTMILVEQDLDRALDFADRIVCMLEGEIVLAGTPSELTHAAITNAYFGLDRSLAETS
jgi:branched-chain amino acid transport system ATP-binding protein